MISRPEYAEASKQLQAISQAYEEKLASELVPAKNVQDSIGVAHRVSKEYHEAYKDLLSDTLARSGVTAASHYNTALNTKLSTEQVNEIVQQQLMRQADEAYYGATLDQRLKGAEMNNFTRIRRSAQVGASLATRKSNLTRIFLNPYPFGAQINVYERILLGQIVKLEHDIAYAFAKRADVKIVKWQLSHRHTKPDICDALATDIDNNVVKWLKENKINIDAKGLYFLENVPNPPHPNCQCQIRMLKDKELTSGRIRRGLGRIRELLGNLLQRP